MIRFAKESGSQTVTNIFTSEPGAQALFSLDFIDRNKLAKILQKFVVSCLTADGKPLEADPLKSLLVSALADIVVADSNEGLEIALDRYIAPGLGTFAKASRMTGGAINTASQAVDLYNSFAVGEKGSVVLINKVSR
jgi:hypothetical protein